MRCTQFYPVLTTPDVAGTAAFYRHHFGFVPQFESEWYVHLQSREDAGVNLAVLQQDHPTIPAPRCGPTSGLLLNFEVEDVDALDRRLRAEGLSPVQPLRDEPFGQRHAIYPAPDGVLIDIITPIPPAPEFLAAYAPGPAP
jgi:catechol 2,3-dioxygenase-like lactoylglutathione lyase family enzyme